MSSSTAADVKYVVQPVVEMKVKQLPQGPLYWRVENFPTLEQAKAAAAAAYRWKPDTVSYEGSPALAAEVAGKAWLFTLGPKGGSTPGGSKVAEVGPVPAFSAPAYLLRINTGTGPFGAATPVHMHPGSEAFYVLAGRLTQKTPLGIVHVAAGQALPGRRPGVPMQIVSTGLDDLLALVMFVVDATAPFSSPAAFQQAHAAIR
jgi:mannose-6-phosphate isomerase-like protein (cupin superfamily)